MNCLIYLYCSICGTLPLFPPSDLASLTSVTVKDCNSLISLPCNLVIDHDRVYWGLCTTFFQSSAVLYYFSDKNKGFSNLSRKQIIDQSTLWMLFTRRFQLKYTVLKVGLQQVVGLDCNHTANDLVLAFDKIRRASFCLSLFDVTGLISVLLR